MGTASNLDLLRSLGFAAAALPKRRPTISSSPRLQLAESAEAARAAAKRALSRKAKRRQRRGACRADQPLLPLSGSATPISRDLPAGRLRGREARKALENGLHVMLFSTTSPSRRDRPQALEPAKAC